MPLAKLKKAELDLAFVIRLFVLFVEEGQSYDQEYSGVGLHANGGFQSRLGVCRGEEDELVDLFF